MRAIAIINQKGGSGKTTTTVNLAAALGEKGRRVLVIDLDPQASTSSWFGITDAGKALLDVFTGDSELAEQAQVSSALGVDVVPCSTWLAGVEKALAGEVGAESILRRKVRKLPKGKWDYLLIDCPPTLGILAINALTAAGEVLIPVEAHVMALAGVAQIIKTAEVVKDRLNPDLELTGIVACRVDSRTRHSLEVVEQLREKFGKLVYKTVIRENVRLAEAPSFAQPITIYDPRSYGAEDYRDLAAEVAKQEPKS
jgi:chromosome partitioning protein